MRWLVTGATGMLGTDLVALLRERGHDVTPATRHTVDHLDLAVVTHLVRGHDVVVNCAGWTAVDDAEEHEDEALQANAVIPDVLARACAETGARLVHVSTDYVFDGSAAAPYSEDARPNPASAYGRTKAAGEEAVRTALPERSYIVRTAWMYGAHGDCFPRTITRLVRERGTVAVVADQVGQPTWTRDVAHLIVRLMTAQVPAGTYHATASGQCSRFEFARDVVATDGLDPGIVTETTTAAFPRPATRPAYSVLAHDALLSVGIDPIGPWRHRWQRAAAEVLAQDRTGSAEA